MTGKNGNIYIKIVFARTMTFLANGLAIWNEW